MRTNRVDRLDREESAQRRLTGKQGERKDKEIVQGWEKEGKELKKDRKGSCGHERG